MGLIAADLPLNAYIGSGALNRVASPPAIHLTLTKEEIEQTYLLYKGTGGTITSMFSTSVTGAKTQVKQELQNKLAAAVNDICTVFGLTKEELAQVCHVQSRKTLYNWIDGKANPRKSAMRRIFDLLTAAQAWRHAGFSSDKVQLRQAVLDGQNLFDILNQEKIDKGLILFVGSRLNIMSPAKGAISDPFA
jgi:transcriptional regulator with XRE-family HTH domain